MTVRVLLVDDHVLVRAGIRSLLAGCKAIEIVGEADDGSEALQKVAQVKPAVVLMDISLPGQSGLDAGACISREFPNVRVIMLSMHDDREYVISAFRSGARGYLLKGVHAPELELAITAVAEGKLFVSPSIAHHLLHDIIPAQDGIPSPARLTARQRQVLQLIAEGQSRKKIAAKLKISAKTADIYRRQLMDKLDINDVPGLVKYALKEGIIKKEGP